MTNNTAGGWRSMAILLSGLELGCGMSSLDPSLPVYTSEQTDSAHPGYMRTTVSTAGVVYVNDFEEQSLLLSNREPEMVVGRRPFGDAKICAIDGQDPSAYLAVDVGSMMPAYEVYRNANHPPFDWRHTTFQKMRLDVLEGPAANKETTDPAMIDDVLSTLREGEPATSVTPPAMAASGIPASVHGVLLFSDQLPGLIFRPSFYVEQSGQVYLAENLVIQFTRPQSVQAAWIPASPLFTRWAQTP